MVEVSSSQQKMLVGNPTSTRGYRTSVAQWQKYKIYAIKDNLVCSTGTLEGNLCYTRCLPITCVSIFSPNANILRIAFGDEAGKVTILKLADGQLTLDKEWPLLPGAVREIVWKSDGKNMIVLGEKACAINPDNGSTTGDVLGATGKILCAALTNDKVLYSAGEFSEILKHEGIPFKGQGKKIDHPHKGFINQLKLCPDGSKFTTGSADKSICVFDAKSGEVIKHYPACHKGGVYDIIWINDTEFISSSADNTAKHWSVESDTCVKTYD